MIPLGFLVQDFSQWYDSVRLFCALNLWLKTFPPPYILLHLVTVGHEVYVFFARELPRNLPRGSAEALVLVGYAGAASREDLDVLPFSSDLLRAEFACVHEVCPWEATGAASSSLIQAGGCGKKPIRAEGFDDIPLLNGSKD